MQVKKKLFILIPIIIILAVGGFFGIEAIIMYNAPDVAEAAETMLTAIISSPLPKEAESDEETDEERDVDDTFFTGSIKIHLADNTDDEEEESEGSSLFVKIIMVILIIIIIALVAFLLFL